MGGNISCGNDWCSRGPNNETKRDENIPVINSMREKEDMKSSIYSSPKIREHIKSHENLFSRLVAHKQDHVLGHVDELNENELEKFYDSLYEVDYELMDMMYNHLILEPEKSMREIEYNPLNKNATYLNHISDENFNRLRNQGLDLISRGKVALILLSGGIGLNSSYRDALGISNVRMPSGKTLFEYYAEKILRISELAKEQCGIKNEKQSIRIYIMTNEMNHEEIIEFFQYHKYFGLDQTMVKFFPQQSLPSMDFYGKLMMEEKHKIYRSPNGSGGVFVSLLRHKILKELKERGITYVHILGVENLLSKPLDPFFLGFTEQSKYDVVNKFLQRNESNSSKPIFATDREKLVVLNLNDETQETFKKKVGKGDYLFDKTYLLDTVFTVNFLEEVLTTKRKEFAKNYHIVKRRIKYYDESLKETVIPLENNGFKFELYSHDILLLVDPNKFGLLETIEDYESAFIKNPDGSNTETFETAKKLMSNCQKSWLNKEGFKFENPEDLLEISFRRVYDERDPNLKLISKDFKNKIMVLPAYIN